MKGYSPVSHRRAAILSDLFVKTHNPDNVIGTNLTWNKLYNALDFEVTYELDGREAYTAFTARLDLAKPLEALKRQVVKYGKN